MTAIKINLHILLDKPDTSFSKLFKYKKYQDLFDFRSIECLISLFSVVILNVIFYISENI